jgi:hypothetical protein
MFEVAEVARLRAPNSGEFGYPQFPKSGASATEKRAFNGCVLDDRPEQAPALLVDAV